MEFMYYAPPKTSTVDRILNASLKLFNEEGFHSVTANGIAKHLGMSAGHLAYHFRRKGDILEALFPRLEKSLRDLIEMEFVHSTAPSIDRSLHVLQIMWEYRFFFTELPQLAALDRKIFQFYLMLEKHVIEQMQHSFDVRIQDGSMRRIAKPNSTALVAKSVWTLWLDWVRHESLIKPGRSVPSDESVHDALLRAYCIVQPFFPQSFLPDVEHELQSRLKLVKRPQNAGKVEAKKTPTRGRTRRAKPGRTAAK